MKTYSLKQLAMLMVTLLLLVTLGSSLLGVYLVDQQFETQQERATADAQRHVNQVAATLGNQIAFYQGIVDIAARRQQVVDLLAFAEENDAISWSLAMRSLLPHAIGAAIAHSDGSIIGDPLAQQVGEQCQIDIHHFATSQPGPFPPVHANNPALAHFDILSRIDGDTADDSGVLLISFQLDVIRNLLAKEVYENEVLSLHTPSQLLIKTHTFDTDMSRYASAVPGTDWTLYLHQHPLTPDNPWLVLLLGDITILGLVSALIAFTTNRYSRMISNDVSWIHASLAKLLQGNFVPGKQSPKSEEVRNIVPDIEKLACQLQRQSDNLRAKTLTDPLTGLRNRRHFDVILEHAYQASQRRTSAILLLIDINEFKTVNDTLGHKAGDELLQTVAFQLKTLTRNGDEVARLGGDEFAVILNDMPSQTIDSWLQRFTMRYDQTIDTIRDRGLSPNVCTLSIGAAPISKSLFDQAADVQDAADLALYLAKSRRKGRSRYNIDSSMPRVASHINTASTTNLRSVPDDKLSNG